MLHAIIHLQERATRDKDERASIPEDAVRFAQEDLGRLIAALDHPWACSR
jgi:hypothetical protein